jgi:predicted flap endonuclease-1-like 5' DNA nuclease
MADSFISTFILGVLTGWLIEWLFYHFIWKNSSAKKAENESQKTKDETSGKPIQQQQTNDAMDEPVPEKVENKDETEEKTKEKMSAKFEETNTNESLQDKPLIKEDLPIKEQTAMPEKQIEKPKKADDLTKIIGIGPSFSRRLKEIGIESFQQLSELTDEDLIKKLSERGARINNKGIMASWADQAKLADVGDFDGLAILQNKLKKG